MEWFPHFLLVSAAAGLPAVGASNATDENRSVHSIVFDLQTLKELLETMPPECFAEDNSRPPFDADAAKAANRVLEKVIAGDLEGFKKAVRQDPEAVHFTWYSFTKLGSDNWGMTALHFAAENGDLAMVRFLLENGAEVNARGPCGNTPLHYAATREVAEALIAGGADVHAKGNRGMTPLHYARNRGVAEVLLAHHAIVDQRSDELGIDLFGHGRKPPDTTPLREAAFHGRLDVVKLLIEHGADVNAKGSEPLFWAAYFGHVETASLLIANGAKVDVKDWRDAPLRAAIEEDHPEILSLLIQAGADLGDPSRRWTLLDSAAWHSRNGQTVALLLEAGLSANTGVGWTPLHSAAEQGNLAAAERLIEAGADIDAKTEDGDTPQTLASRLETFEWNGLYQGYPDMIRAWNEADRRGIESRNANRRILAKLLYRLSTERTADARTAPRPVRR